MPSLATRAAGGVSQLRRSNLRCRIARSDPTPWGLFPVMKGHEDGGKCSLEWRKLFPRPRSEALSADILRKEVIQPQVPLRLPCYDFTPVAEPTVVSCLLAVSALPSGESNSHGVTGGVYKAWERIHRGMLIRDY